MSVNPVWGVNRSEPKPPKQVTLNHRVGGSSPSRRTIKDAVQAIEMNPNTFSNNFALNERKHLTSYGLKITFKKFSLKPHRVYQETKNLQ